MLGLLRPACLLLRNVARVAQRDRVRLFADVEPFFVPGVERRVPWAVQVLGFHAVMKVEVHTSGYLQTPFFRRQKRWRENRNRAGSRHMLCRDV